MIPQEQHISELIRDCLKGDAGAQKALYIRFSPKVRTICRRYMSKDHVPDAMQECFIQIFRSLKNYKSTNGDINGWIYRLCQWTLLKMIKKNKIKFSEVDMVSLDNHHQVPPSILSSLHTETIIGLIQSLPDGYRIILNLFVFEEYTHREIANILHISESTSRSQLTRARALLKSKLSQLNQYKHAK